MQSKRVWLAAVVVLAVLAVGVSRAAAEVPVSMTHQGRLLDDAGEPMTGTTTLKFSIYDAASDGALLWESRDLQVDLGDTGFYSVTLGGSENPIDVQKLGNEKAAYITMSVDGGEELSPRLKLRSVPFALRAGQADTVAEGAVDEAAIADGAVGDAEISGVDWAKVQNAPQTLGGMNCVDGQQAVFGENGQWSCADPPSYSGQDFATSDQRCNMGDVAVGIDQSGKIVCRTDQNTTYKAGGGLALSGDTFQIAPQGCPGSQVAVGFAMDGSLNCRADRDTTYGAGAGLNLSGGNFELAAQNCPPGRYAAGIDGGGKLICRADQDSGGDITRVRAGSGLNGGSSSGTATLSADYDEVQRRVSGTCATGEFMVGVNKDGSLNCRAAPGGSGSCPFNGSSDGPACDQVQPGMFCEFDSTSNCGLDNNLNNCGSFDWYMRTSGSPGSCSSGQFEIAQ